jgi:hypothetical protein
MKKIFLVVFLMVLMLSYYFSSRKVSAENIEFSDEYQVTFGKPSNSTEILAADNSSEEFFDATNPYADICGHESKEEVDDSEGENPFYVLVFADEEERSILRYLKLGGELWATEYNWTDWAKLCIERGDEALISNFGIDIRILGFETWDSDDSVESMIGLLDELISETSSYLGQWYSGPWWSNYVDGILGITFQATPDTPDILGLASGQRLVDQGKSFVFLRWHNTYWGDDNLLQHEVSHLFYAQDHYYTCCAMAGHTHYQTFIYEDGAWSVFGDVLCALTSYDWCSHCKNFTDIYKELYDPIFPDVLVVRVGPTVYPYTRYGSLEIAVGGVTEPLNPGIYIFGSSIEITVSIASVSSGYSFDYWLINGEQKIFTETLTINIIGKQTITAYFKKTYSPSPPPGTGGGHGGGQPFIHGGARLK